MTYTHLRGRQRFPQASFVLLRVRPVPLSRLVWDYSSSSRQACAGLWLGSPAARLGLWNNRRPPGRLGGVCEPRRRTGERLAEWCVLPNTQLACLPHANGPTVTTAHAIGSRRPEEYQAGLNTPPHLLFHDPLFRCLPLPSQPSFTFFAVSCTDTCKFACSTHPRRFLVQITDIFTRLLWTIGTCPRAEQLHSLVRTDRERVSRRSVLPNGQSSRFLAWRCAGVGCESRWTRPLAEIEKENVKIGTLRTECSRKPG